MSAMSRSKTWCASTVVATCTSKAGSLDTDLCVLGRVGGALADKQSWDLHRVCEAKAGSLHYCVYKVCNILQFSLRKDS